MQLENLIEGISIKRNKKVSFGDRNVLDSFFKTISIISTVATLYALFGKIPDKSQKPLGVIFIIILALIYFIIWINANSLKKTSLKINDTKVNVILGNIFEQSGLKVIGVNDFIDTINDNKIIARSTLHGLFLEKYSLSIQDLDRQISNNELLKKNIVNSNEKRIQGKSIRYKLGSVIEYENYVLATFTKFNEKNEAWLSAEEYVGFWMEFWKNIDTIYGGRTINIPLMGAGITRFKNGKPSKQKLLETMILTLKISGFQCTYNKHCINFIVYPDDVDDIDFYAIKKLGDSR